MFKRIVFWLVGIGLGVLVWRRLRGADEGFDQPWEAPVSPEGKLGGEVDPELLAILACPLDKAPISREGDYIVCSRCARRYPIRDGIPVMLVEEAVVPEQPPAAAAEPASGEPPPPEQGPAEEPSARQEST